MIHHYLILGILLFGIGIVGLISRRNIIIVYMSVELLLNGVNLALVAVSSHLQQSDGQIIAMIIIAIAAAEAALFMALFVVLFRSRRSLDANIFTLLGGRRD
jgi:NADH-quinone oxidoreductase subunit K